MRDAVSRPARTTVQQPKWRFRRPDPRPALLILCATALLSGGGCTTTRTVDPQNQSAMTSLLDKGDSVKATLRDGREVQLTFVEETADHVVGRDRTDTVLRISRQDISYLEVQKPAIVRTVLLVGSVVLVVGLAQYVGAHAAFLSGGW